MQTTASTTERKLPRGWRWAPLREVCEFLDSRRVPVNDVERSKRIAGKAPAELYPYYGANGQVGLIDDYLFEEPLILLAEDGGNFGSHDRPIAYSVSGRYWVNNHAHVLRPREVIDFDYCLHALRIRPDVQELVSGTTRAKLNQETAGKIPIPLPPLPEQRRIATILNEQIRVAAMARAAAESQLEAAESLISAYLCAAFDGEEADRWSKTKMDSIASMVIDGPHVTPSYVSQGIPFLTVRNIVSRRIDTSEVSFISPNDHAAFSKRGKAERGDILYTKDGTLGIPCVVDTDLDFSFFVSVALIKLRREAADPDYIAFALESPGVLKQVAQLSAGAGLKHMVLKSIKALEIPLPSLGEQRRVAAALSEQISKTQTLCDRLRAKLAAINILPGAFLRAAFNGEL
jgi:type I restriction enzyme S subunit